MLRTGNIPPQGYQPSVEAIWGIAGTNQEARLGAGHTVFYVDPSHASADDSNYGTNPDAPLATLQELINRSLGTGNLTAPALGDYDVVFVNSSLEEDVATGDYDEMPSYVSIIGGGYGRYSPAWVGNDANTASLDLRCIGWRISGFRFYGKTGAPCIVLNHTDLGGNDIAIRIGDLPGKNLVKNNAQTVNICPAIYFFTPYLFGTHVFGCAHRHPGPG